MIKAEHMQPSFNRIMLYVRDVQATCNVYFGNSTSIRNRAFACH